MLKAELCREILSYDPETGEFDRSKYRHKGKMVGWKDELGYIHIRVNKVLYLAHRLAWLHFYGKWPRGGLDHINGDPSDNRIANLREANQSQNMRNTPIAKKNTSGRKGVSWDKQKNLWRATITLHRRQRFVGRFSNVDDAIKAREIAEQTFHGEFSRPA